jgi:hypothetical protein
MAKANPSRTAPAPPPKEKQKPAAEIRLGRIRATIWANAKDDGSIWYSCVLSRSYKKDDGSWANSDSMGRDDLLTGSEALRQAALWIYRQQIQERNGQNGEGEEPIPF